MNKTIAGVEIPDGVLERAATEKIRGTESESMYGHALRSYLFGALTGYREQLTFDAELLYIGALFHNAGLDAQQQSSPHRFEIDGANAACEFLRAYAVNERDIDAVWEAVALHMTPAIPEYRLPLVALLSAGVQIDLRGAYYNEFTAQQRDEVVRAYPREPGFTEKIIEAYARGLEQRPETTFGTVHADVLDRWDPNYRRLNFCGLVLGSDWPN